MLDLLPPEFPIAGRLLDYTSFIGPNPYPMSNSTAREEMTRILSSTTVSLAKVKCNHAHTHLRRAETTTHNPSSSLHLLERSVRDEVSRGRGGDGGLTG